MNCPAAYRNFWILLFRGLGKPVPEDGCLVLPLPAQEWNLIYFTSLVQGVCGIVYCAVENLPADSGIPDELALQWKNTVDMIEKHNLDVGRVAEHQKRIWEKYGLDAVLVKGPESAKMYPYPQRRMGGDIDWWFRGEGDWDKALEIVEKNSLVWNRDSDGDVNYVLSGVVVEHHRHGLDAEGPMGELLLRCEHALHHAMVTGMGLKQYCDYIMALDYYRGQYDETEYSSLLSSRGVSEWERRLRSEDPRLLKMVFRDGQMGRGKRFRFGGFFPRALYFLRVCPGLFLNRWAGLVFGHIGRI